MSLNYETVLLHAGALQRATNLSQLMRVTRDAVFSMTRYRHAWLALFEGDNSSVARFLDGDEGVRELGLEHCLAMPVAGDAMLQEILVQRRPVVVVEARTDPRTNKDLVAKVGNRTIVNVPITLGSALVGALGVGTLNDEGPMEPTGDELDMLLVFGTQLAAAFHRVTVEDASRALEAERHRLTQQLEAVQRLDLMGVLASGVAHDLNNLLVIMMGGLGNLETTVSPEDQPVVAQSLEAALRARDVVAQLLTLGRTGGNARAPLDVGDHVRRTVALLKSSFRPEVRVEMSLHPVPNVMADPVQVDQAVANVLLNARDAVGNRGVIQVTVEERHLDEPFASQRAWARPGHYACISITDSGPGIPDDVQRRIFEPLFTTKANGTGLGLPLVARVMHQHGGLVNCQSSPGAGATFRLFLPIAPGAATPPH